ncbi:LytR/AlgR family response regulator transcription factor [Sediminicola luteus]|uniref:DNA-binding response regulator n=1 Tax=Sediminicola luteus TaxID=319238 RepID=A0A2A4G7Y1_9FLAO|nr:LytTR family DNA-binding domain-containing protein [Sediminicola luteus]PCE64088.1 DNA-binding response regulator [Sediminicola luteus]
MGKQTKIKCIIVDDEPLARDVLEQYAQEMDQLEVVASCGNALEAFKHIQEGGIDLVFLDIKMPKLNGLELLQSLKNPPLVVFTTAYREYAIQAFELDAIDYLLKPISLTRFLKTVAKAHRFLCGQTHPAFEPLADPPTEEEPQDKATIYIKSDRKVVKLDLTQIYYLESLNDKVLVHVQGREVSTNQRISYLEEKLPKPRFVRIHRSFIVALDKVNAYNNIMVEVDGRELPIGRNYRSHALELLRAH